MIKKPLAKVERAQKNPRKLAVAAAAIEKYVRVAELGLQIAQDKRFGRRLFSGIDHSREAWHRARQTGGFAGPARQLAADQALHAELRNARRDLAKAYARVEAKRGSRRVITSLAGLTSLAGVASLAAVPQVRDRVSALIAGASRGGRQLHDLAISNGFVQSEPRPNTLEDLTKEKLYARAQEAGIPGRSEMSKEELIEALRAKS